MSVLTGVLSYAMIWMVTLFVVLPWGVRPAEHPGPGHAAGAPDQPRIGLKLAVTSAIALFLWVLFFFVERAGFITFR